MKLKIELVPSSSWGNNLRSEANIPKKEWDILRKACYAKAGHKCEVCGGVGWRRYNGKPKSIVECHEVWAYDDEKGVQRLEGLVALCPTCHRAKHLGFAYTMSVQKNDPKIFISVLEHIQKVNGLSDEELLSYVEEVFEKHGERSSREWALDLSWLEKQRGES